METGPLPIPHIQSLPETMDAVHAESDRLADRVHAAVDRMQEVSDVDFNIMLTAALDVAELDYQLTNGYIHYVWFTSAGVK